MSASEGLRGHQAVVSWRGADLLTLAPLWPPTGLLRAVIVGINPAPVSVERGHYYQGSMGRHAMAVLRRAGVLAWDSDEEFEDDAAVSQGIGFTDLVPRPTARASQIPAGERAAGVEVLRAELSDRRPGLILAVFKPPVVALFGRGHGASGLQTARFEGIPVVKLPVTNTRREVAAAATDEVARVWQKLYPNDGSVR